MRFFIATLFFLLSLPLPGSTLAERELIAVVGIRQMKLQGSHLVYSYILPCQAQPVGLFVEPIKKGTELRVAVVVRQPGVRCAGMPSLETRHTNLLRFKGVKKLVKMSPTRLKGKLRLGRVASLRRVGPDRRIEGIWERSCATWRGFVLQPDHQPQLGLGFLESVSPDDLKTCRSGEKVFRPRFIDHQTVQGIYPIDENFPIEQAFHLRLAPIRPGSLAGGSGSNGVNLQYIKRCNEAPVGVVVGRPGQARAMRIGMVVAHFYNRTCEAGEPRTKAIAYSSPTYPVKPGVNLVAMPPSRGFGDYRVKMALQFGFLDEELQVRVLGGCQREVGVIYSGDGAGRILVGVLEKATANSRCKKPTKKISFQQPYFLSSPTSQDHFPMKVRGATIF